MSAGHHHTEKRHSPALEREFKKLMEEPRIQAFMRQRYGVSYAYQIPLTGGSSIKGDMYYIDPDVPMSYRKYVLAHERYEKVFREVLGMRYARAHELATVGERLEVEADGHNWTSYKKAIAKPVRLNEKQGSNKLPPDFDYGPMTESGKP